MSDGYVKLSEAKVRGVIIRNITLYSMWALKTLITKFVMRVTNTDTF